MDDGAAASVHGIELSKIAQGAYEPWPAGVIEVVLFREPDGFDVYVLTAGEARAVNKHIGDTFDEASVLCGLVAAAEGIPCPIGWISRTAVALTHRALSTQKAPT